MHLILDKLKDLTSTCTYVLPDSLRFFLSIKIPPCPPVRYNTGHFMIMSCCRPVMPNRPVTRDEERYMGAMFMSIDGRQITCTPRDDLPFKTVTLPGATSDYRMGPLIHHDDIKRTKAWANVVATGEQQF